MSTVIGNSFIVRSDDPEENSERYVFGRIVVYRNLTSVFNAIKKIFKGKVTFTVNVEEFIRKHTGQDFKPTKVGYIGDESDCQDVIVKCVYGED